MEKKRYLSTRSIYVGEGIERGRSSVEFFIMKYIKPINHLKAMTIKRTIFHSAHALACLLVMVLSAGMLLAGLSWPVVVAAQNKNDVEALVRASKARAAIVKRVSVSVVHISVEKRVQTSARENFPFDDPFFRRFFSPENIPRNNESQLQRGSGSGFVVDSRGYVLTNNHVVAGAGMIEVKLKDGRRFTAQLVGADPATDLAVLRIQASGLRKAQLGNSDALEVGETVIAIGSPFGLEQTITQGIVSAKGRTQLGQVDYEDFIQTDASINPGNSGGPLVNLRGEVVGMNTAIFSRSGGSLGVGFAIPINMVKQVSQALISSGRVSRGFLGVSIQDIDNTLAKALEVKPLTGVLLSQVGKNSPAEKAGMRQGDIITHFDKHRVLSVGELRNRVARIKPGSSVDVNILRTGKRRKFKVKVGELPNPSRPTASASPKTSTQNKKVPANRLGLTVQDINPSVASRLGYQGLNGVLVAEVFPGSAAARAGLRQGALIREVDHKSVRTARQLERLLERVPSGQALLLLVNFGNGVRYLGLVIP